MPRKLRHTLRAFAIAVSLFTVGLIASAPPPAPGTTGLTVATDPAAAPTVESRPAPRPASPYSSHRRSRRESMALPFFSFAQGLRSGNRS